MATSGVIKSNPLSPWLLGVLLVGAAFLGARYSIGSGILSLIPPPTTDDPNPVADVTPERVEMLYQSAYTAWAALLLTLPAMAFFWIRARSWAGYTVWRVFWTVGFVAFAIHMGVSMFGFFGGDFEAMQNTSRVSAFWPGIIFTIWWAIDVLISWNSRTESDFVTIQRYLLHFAALILFVGGSLVTGETAFVKALGALFALAFAGGLAVSREP